MKPFAKKKAIAMSQLFLLFSNAEEEEEERRKSQSDRPSRRQLRGERKLVLLTESGLRTQQRPAQK